MQATCARRLRGATLRSPMSSNNSLLVDSAMILAMILIGIVAYKVSPLLMPKADVTVDSGLGCDLQQGSCGVALPQGGRLQFFMMPRPIPVSEPVQMTVDLEGVAADRVVVDFAGVSMNMGFNRPALEKTSPGHFTGQATLPVCVTGRMTWQATVLVESGQSRIAVPFRFDAGH